MTTAGRKAALSHGEQLPTFESPEVAESSLLGLRDQLLAELQRLVKETGFGQLDFSPMSLKAVEKWFFTTAESPGFASYSADSEVVRKAVGVYLGEVLVRSDPSWRWAVEKFPFMPNRYELGVCKPLVSIMLLPGSGVLNEQTSGKRRESLWRLYKQYAGQR
jgi:hypothetical protein